MTDAQKSGDALDVSHTERRLAARIAAVQAVYEHLMTGRSVREIIRDMMDQSGIHVDTEEENTPCSVALDRGVFSSVAQGVSDRLADIEAVVTAHYNKEGKAIEALLKSVLLCGCWELMCKMETDAPIIINDYLDVTHGFFDQNEVRLVNGILDNVAKTVRV